MGGRLLLKRGRRSLVPSVQFQIICTPAGWEFTLRSPGPVPKSFRRVTRATARICVSW
jgi:hypothetical protein